MNVKVSAGTVVQCPFDEDEKFNNGQENVRAVLKTSKRDLIYFFSINSYTRGSHMKKTSLTLLLFFLFQAGCFNLATPPSQISGSYTSELRYQSYTCEELSAELSSLARRENQLVTAQEQRRKTSMVQAFWIGYGNGDGIEAAELANVRGEKEAVRKAIDSNRCGASKNVSSKSVITTQPAGPLNDDLRRDLETIEQWRSAGILTEKEAVELRREALQKY